MLRSVQRTQGAAVFLCLALLCGLIFVNFGPKQAVFSNDAAVSFAVANGMLRGEVPLLGPPSHLGGRHLGPVYYWGLALEQFLVGKDPYKTILLDALLKLLSAAVYLYFIALLLPRASSWIAASVFLLLLCSGQFVSIARFSWHSSFLLLPAAALFHSAARLLLKRKGSVLIFLGLACLTLQTHFASAPYILALSMLLFWQRRAAPEVWSSFSFFKAAPLAALLFLPAVLYELSHPSNLGALLAVHTDHGPAKAGLRGALALLSEFFRLSLSGSNLFEEFFGRLAWLIKLLLAGSGAFLTFDFWRCSTRERRIGLALALVPVLVYVPFLALLGKPIFHFYLNSVALLPALFLALLAWHAALRLAESCRRENLILNSAAGCYLVLLLLVLSFSICINARNLRLGNIPSTSSMQHAAEVARVIIRDRAAGAEPAKIFIRAHGKIRESAIYYFLGPAYYPLMQYSRSFAELPSFLSSGRPAPQQAYFISCPEADGAQAIQMGETLAKKWRSQGEVELAGCPSCAGCRIVKMVRKRGDAGRNIG